MYQQYNYGKSSAKNLLCYCRPSVEKYVFAQLSACLNSIYEKSNKQFNDEYKIKKEKLCTIKNAELLRLLKVPNDFIPNEATPYKNGIQALNCIEGRYSPLDKIKEIMKMNIELKVSMLEYAEGKEKLIDNENISKMFMYLIIKSDIKSPKSEFSILKDYLNAHHNEYNSEKVMIDKLEASLISLIHINGSMC